MTKRNGALVTATAVAVAIIVGTGGLPALASITSVTLSSAGVSQDVHCPATLSFTGTIAGTPNADVEYFFAQRFDGLELGGTPVIKKMPASGTLGVSFKVEVPADALAEPDNYVRLSADAVYQIPRDPSDPNKGPLYAGGNHMDSTDVTYKVVCKPALVWCSTAQYADLESASPNPGWLGNYQQAHRALCAGDAATARARFAAMLPSMNKYERADGSAYNDYARSYFYALLAARDYQGARRFLTSWEAGGWKAGKGERLFWNGDYAGSFAAFVAEDGNVLRNPDQQNEHKLDPHLNYALADVRAGRLDDAAREMQADPDSADLYLLMLGNIYAQERRWPEAFTAWVAAAAIPPGFAEPELVNIQNWNLSALEMMYYYRAHAPAYAAPPPFSCGSPTDLATVESLALKLPETMGLDATRIMDAVAAGGYARVDVETKGVYPAYFQYRDGAWTPAAQSDLKTRLPNAQLCRNPQFVNRPSGP